MLISCSRERIVRPKLDIRRVGELVLTVFAEENKNNQVQ